MDRAGLASLPRTRAPVQLTPKTPRGIAARPGSLRQWPPRGSARRQFRHLRGNGTGHVGGDGNGLAPGRTPAIRTRDAEGRPDTAHFRVRTGRPVCAVAHHARPNLTRELGPGERFRFRSRKAQLPVVTLRGHVNSSIARAGHDRRPALGARAGHWGDSASATCSGDGAEETPLLTATIRGCALGTSATVVPPRAAIPESERARLGADPAASCVRAGFAEVATAVPQIRRQ